MCQFITKAAVDGSYNDPFLETPNRRSDTKSVSALSYRTSTNHSPNNMAKGGHKYKIIDSQRRQPMRKL
ncbi:hypothetical protein BU25DRAFT_253616 [Macroventuria anomochaeta]|uniref:Uncharacterized protein n=1 Tax=Macroventuria anomochaeta TaxID=301207 RepID=A0ACB6RGV8_9PLEO|nr:uncharacterized protein BU25DRAFT_253616 [Macroventuria anomochaeta]KAF2621093.1 hypothetical protein BU25DRAFT_253616 [Macroventuria anomochaeta]